MNPISGLEIVDFDKNREYYLKGEKIVITDKNNQDYKQEFVILWKHENFYCYGNNVNDTIARNYVGFTQFKFI